MKIVRAKHAGFCFGVRRAIEAAERVAREGGGAPVRTDGPLIHNAREVARLAALGVTACDDPAALPRGATLLVRAHGVPPARREWLDSLGLRVIDETCPNVTRIQRACAAAAAEGRAVLILGDAGHAEVVGLLGCAGPRAAVVDGPAAVDALPAPGAPVALVSQSTQSDALFRETAEAVRRRWPDARVENTICAATRDRQGDLAGLAASCDAIVVVGSPESANTQRLFRLASALRPAFVVDSASQIRPADFASFRTVGLTAGASTPDDLIAEVEEALARPRGADGTPPADRRRPPLAVKLLPSVLLLAGLLAVSSQGAEPSNVPEPTRAELVSADASLDVVRDVCSRTLDALLAELRARYPGIDARRSAGRSKKNDYRNYQWISVKSGGREYLLATHHGNLDVRTGNPHAQFGRIQFWRCEGPQGPHSRDESGVWRFRADNEDRTLPATHVWDEDYSSAAVVDRFVAFLERCGEGPVLSALANQSSVAPAVPAGTMAAGTAAATEDFATTGTDSGPSPSRRDGAAPTLRGLPSEARLGESPRSADPPLSERRRADEAIENVRAVEAKAMAAIVAELRRRHPEWKVRTSRGNSRVNDYRCYQWITVRVAEDDVRWITLVFNDQDPATGNTHSQFGRIQFWSGVDRHNGPQNEAGPHTRDAGGWRFRSDKQWADMPRLHLWSPEYSSAHVVDLFETFVGR